MTTFINRLLGLHSDNTNSIAGEVAELSKYWTDRNKAMTRWYEQLRMDDKLAQKNMESFVSNDTRTTWNMATYLLQPKALTHTIVSVTGSIIAPDMSDILEVIKLRIKQLWDNIERQNILAGKQSWFWDMIGLFTATGWYAVTNVTDKTGKPVVNYWHPATVFPEFAEGSLGLIRLGRQRMLSAEQAKSQAISEGWRTDYNIAGRVSESQLWKLSNNTVLHGVEYNNITVKPMTPTGLTKIPVYVGYAGGLPDIGVLDDKFRENMGQSILAINEHVYSNFNRLQTFLQQLIRDAANPRVFEKSTGPKPLINIEEWYKRGAVFRGGPNDSIDVIQMPGIPVELTSYLFQIRNQMQRGSFSDLTFGNILQEVSSIVMSQAANAAEQLLYPYWTAIQALITAISDEWYQELLIDASKRPSNWPKFDSAKLADTRVVSKYTIKIPGDLNNRINLAKSLNGRMELPVSTLTEMFLPEISNPKEIEGKLDAERAKLIPEYQKVVLIKAFDNMVAQARELGDTQMAELASIVSGMLKQQLGQVTAEQRMGDVNSDSIVNARLGDGGQNGAI